jgi:hypothetical protein
MLIVFVMHLLLKLNNGPASAANDDPTGPLVELTFKDACSEKWPLIGNVNQEIGCFLSGCGNKQEI